MPLEIRMLESVDEVTLGCNFFDSVWGGDEPVLPADIAIASGHSGGYFSGAFDESGTLVAASYGFLGRHGSASTIHSHVTASKRPGAGFALKMHQKDWAQAQGLSAITWTFDPLVRRNCAFNIEKLGAVAIEYLANFYGVMNDELNRGDESDRLLAFWPMQPEISPVTKVNSEPKSLIAPAAVSIDEHGGPAINAGLLQAFEARLPFAVYLPEDIESLRTSNIEVAKRWRFAVREILQPSFASGARIIHMIEDRAALLVEWPKEGAE